MKRLLIALCALFLFSAPAFADFYQVGGSGGGSGDSITSPNSSLVIGGTSTATTLDIAGAAAASIGTYLQKSGTGTFAWTTPSGSGGDTITSPNSTLAVGGTSSNTTLDVAGFAAASNNSYLGKNGSGVAAWLANAVNGGTGGQLSGYATTGSVLSGLANFNFTNGLLTFGGSSVAGLLGLNDASGHVTTISQPTASANLTLKLPTTAGVNTNVLSTDGAGNLSWATNGVASANTPTSRVVPSYSVPWVLPAGQPASYTLINNGYYVNYPVTGSTSPNAICLGADGNLWYTDLSTSPNSVTKVTPAGVSTVYTDPTASARPSFIAAGPDGNVWWTELTASNISKITPGGTITQYTLPGRGSGLCVGPDGNMYTGGQNTGAGHLYQVTTAGTVTTFSYPTSSLGVNGACTGPDGSIWFCEAASTAGTTNNLAKFNVTTHAFVEYPIPTLACNLYGCCVGPDGNIWFSENTGNVVGKCTTAGVITEYTIPTSSSQVEGICAGPDGNIWFTENGNAKVGFVTTNGLFTEYSITGALRSLFVCAGPDGNMYMPVNNGSGIFCLSLQAVGGSRAFSGPQNKVAGSSGFYVFTQPEQGAGYKKVVIAFSGYTNASTSSITFPVPFLYTPSIGANGTGLTPTGLSTTGVTIPTGTTVNGAITYEGI